MTTKVQRNPSTLKLMRNAATGKLMRTFEPCEKNCQHCAGTPKWITVTLTELVNCSCMNMPFYSVLPVGIAENLNGKKLHIECKGLYYPCEWWAEYVPGDFGQYHEYPEQDCQGEPILYDLDFLYAVIKKESPTQVTLEIGVGTSPHPFVSFEVARLDLKTVEFTGCMSFLTSNDVVCGVLNEPYMFGPGCDGGLIRIQNAYK